MGQRIVHQSRALFWVVMGVLLLMGCDRSANPATTSPAGGASARPTVASLVPAATDLILGMGAQDHLVAVSNWDPNRPAFAHLPRVGDYRSIDWEQLARLKPDVMITQFRADKMPAGLQQRADQMKIRVVNVSIYHLEDIFRSIAQLGEALNEKPRAEHASKALRGQLDAVRTSVAGKTPVRTLIVRTGTGLDVVGGGNFMNDLLELAGGENVIKGGENSYPTIDRELLLTLDPQVILQLLPEASPQVMVQARDFWTTLPQLQAVKNDRVHRLTDDYLLLPGFSAGKIAELFAQKLHRHPEGR